MANASQPLRSGDRPSRVPLELGPWSSPDEPGWRAAYDGLIDEALAAGESAIAGLETGLVPTPPPEGLAEEGSEEAALWLAAYVDHAARAAAPLLRDRRVAALEVLPQAETTAEVGPRVHPTWMARALDDLAAALAAAGADAAGRLLPCVPAGPRGGAAYYAAVRAAGGAAEPLGGAAYRMTLGAPGELGALADAVAADLGARGRVWVTGFVLGASRDPLEVEVALTAAVAANDADPRAVLAAHAPDGLWPVGPEAALGPNRGPEARPMTLFLPARIGPPRSTTLAEPPVVDGFDYPVGPRDADPWETYKMSYGVCDEEYYRLMNKTWHPGEDWNGKGGGDTDKGDPIYAIAHGVVATAAYYPVSWGNTVLVRHALPDGSTVWSQYTHLDAMQVAEGDLVMRGDPVGTMGKGAGDKWIAHLHFEIRIADLPADNWSPMVRDKEKVLEHYAVAKDFIAERRPGMLAGPGAATVVVDEAGGSFVKAGFAGAKPVGLGHGGGGLFLPTTDGAAANTGTWTAALPEPGDYQVSVYVPRVHATTQNAAYTVVHAAGETVVRKAQKPYSDQWVPLGRFRFGAEGRVRLTDATGEAPALRREIAFDAVRWTRMP